MLCVHTVNRNGSVFPVVAVRYCTLNNSYRSKNGQNGKNEDPEAKALPYANYVPKSFCVVNEKGTTASYQNDKELVKDITILANSMIPLHTLHEMRNHMQPRARVKWDRYLAKAVELSGQLEEEYLRKLGPSPNIVPDLTTWRKTDEHYREGMRQWADVHLPKNQPGRDDDQVHAEPDPDDAEHEDARHARLNRLDEEQLGAGGGEEEEDGEHVVARVEEGNDEAYVPEYVTVLTKFLRLATEGRVVNTSDLDDEQLFTTLQQMERERASTTPDKMPFYPTVDVDVDIPLTKEQQAVYDQLPDPRKDDAFAKSLGVRMPGEEEELEDPAVQQLLVRKLDALKEMAARKSRGQDGGLDDGSQRSRGIHRGERGQRGVLDPFTGEYALEDIPSDDASEYDAEGGYEGMSDGRGKLAFDPGNDDDLSAELEAEEFADEDEEPDAGRWARGRHGAVDDSNAAENEKEITERALEELYDSQSVDWQEGFGGLEDGVDSGTAKKEKEMEDSYGEAASSELSEVDLQGNIPEKKLLESRDRPLGFMWKIDQYVDWRDTKYKRWFEFEDAVMIHFEEEIVEGGQSLVHRNVTEILPQDQKKDAIDIVKSKLEEPVAVAKEILKTKQERGDISLEKSQRFAEIEAKFLALCPDAKPMSVEEFLTRAAPDEDEDALAVSAQSQAEYEEKMKQLMQKENDPFTKLRLQMRRRIEYDQVEAFLPYLYLLEFWREQTDTPDENLEVLTKTMEPLQKRLFIKNQNDILSGMVRDLYDARPDIYQYFTTRLLIPPPTLTDDAERQRFIATMEAQYPVVQPALDYRQALASIMHSSPTFLGTLADVLLEDDEAMAAQYKAEAETISPERLAALRQELEENDREANDGAAPPTEETLGGASLQERQQEVFKETYEKIVKKLEDLQNRELSVLNKQKVMNTFEHVIHHANSLMGGLTEADIFADEDEEREGESEKDHEPLGLQEHPEGEDPLMQQLDSFDEEKDMEYLKKSVEWNSLEDQKLSHIPFEPEDGDSDLPSNTQGFNELVQAPEVVRRRIGILSFALKQLYLSEVETVVDLNNPEGQEIDGMQKYHKTRIIDIPPNWLLEFKRVPWPDYTHDLETLVPHMPGQMVFESRSGENDELRRLFRNGAAMDPNNE